MPEMKDARTSSGTINQDEAKKITMSKYVGFELKKVDRANLDSMINFMRDSVTQRRNIWVGLTGVADKPPKYKNKKDRDENPTNLENEGN